MRTILAACILSIPLASAAASTVAEGARATPGFHQRLYERYCDKLRESPEAYVRFVKRMQPLHGYTFEDFAPARPGDEVRANCGVGPERIAAVHRSLREAPAAAAARQDAHAQP
jgi:hypothetical protein